MKRFSFLLVIVLIFGISLNIQSKASESEDTEKEMGFIKMNKLQGETDLYNDVMFTHRLHSEMSDMSGGCEMCHHYTDPEDVVGCESCHSKDRKREDLLDLPDLKGAYHRMCMDCHREWTGEVECYSCHSLRGSETSKVSTEKTHGKIEVPSKIRYETPGAEGAMVDFFHNDHIDVFGVKCKDCHFDEGCIKCHDKRSLTQKVKAEKEDFHETCSNCHDTDDNCMSCHSDEEREGFNHLKRTGFDTAKIHSELKCANCHAEPGSFEGLSNSCEDCHDDWPPENFSHEVTGLILDETHSDFECEICHAEEDYSKLNCADCHDDEVTYPDIIPGELLE